MNSTATRISKLLTILILIISANAAYAEVINSIVAYVGNRAITRYDIQNLDPAEYAKLLAIKEEGYRQKQIADYEAQALEYIISQEIIAIAAEREGVKVTDKEVDTAISEIITRNKLDPKKLEEYLTKEGLSMAKYRLQLKNEILNARVRNQVLMPKIVIVERDLRAAADANAEEFQLHDRYQVRILLTQNKETLNKALKEIKSGMPFADAVTKFSIDKSAVNGGEMGWMEIELLSLNMQDALKPSKIGEITKPFEVNGQWGVFLVEGFKSKYDFDDETRAKLHEAAGDRLFKNVFESWLSKNKETIVVMKAGETFKSE